MTIATALKGAYRHAVTLLASGALSAHSCGLWTTPRVAAGALLWSGRSPKPALRCRSALEHSFPLQLSDGHKVTIDPSSLIVRGRRLFIFGFGGRTLIQSDTSFAPGQLGDASQPLPLGIDVSLDSATATLVRSPLRSLPFGLIRAAPSSGTEGSIDVLLAVHDRTDSAATLWFGKLSDQRWREVRRLSTAPASGLNRRRASDLVEAQAGTLAFAYPLPRGAMGAAPRPGAVVLSITHRGVRVDTVHTTAPVEAVLLAPRPPRNAGLFLYLLGRYVDTSGLHAVALLRTAVRGTGLAPLVVAAYDPVHVRDPAISVVRAGHLMSWATSGSTQYGVDLGVTQLRDPRTGRPISDAQVARVAVDERVISVGLSDTQVALITAAEPTRDSVRIQVWQNGALYSAGSVPVRTYNPTMAAVRIDGDRVAIVSGEFEMTGGRVKAMSRLSVVRISCQPNPT